MDYDDDKFVELTGVPNFKAQPLDELNILILGRTSVGKSTWINAFVNYLLHPSLDDGLKAEKLSWVIPFAFRTYSVNEDGEFEDLKFQVAFDQLPSSPSTPNQKIGVQEQDGSAGGSATQRTVVHKVQIGRRLVRLIDTPGIGDTRGAAKDREPERHRRRAAHLQTCPWHTDTAEAQRAEIGLDVQVLRAGTFHPPAP